MKPASVPRAWPPLAALLGVWLLATVTVRPLMLPDEGRYVGVALEMLRSGDWLVPTLDGLPYFHKPPLFYWITASAMAIGGVNLLAARAAALVGALTTLLFLAWFARRWMSDRASAWTPWILATMPMFFVAAQFANLDLLVAACITASILCLADAMLRESADPAIGRSLAIGWLMMALGVLAKGLIGCVLPPAVIVGWLLWQRRLSPRSFASLRRLVRWPAVVLFAAVALPWFVLVQLRYPGFFDYFVVHQHLERFAASGFNNEQPFWFYAPVVAGLTLPWFVWLRPVAADHAAAESSQQALRSLGWWWLVVIVVFFSLPRSKLVGYVLPALPAIALLVADAVCNRPESWLGAGRRLAWTGALAALLCLAAVFAVARVQVDRDHAAIARTLDAQAAAGEPVYALNLQPYDLVYQLQVRRPLVLVADWADPAIARHDDWRKELADAARFAPGRAVEVLHTRVTARARWCTRAVNWVIADLGGAAQEPELKDLPPVSRTKVAGLWRLDRAQLERTDACR